MSAKLFFKWLSVIAIHPIMLYLILKTQMTIDPIIPLIIFLSLLIILLIVIFYSFSRVRSHEKKFAPTKKNDRLTVELCLVGKNEGEIIIRTLEHYLSFPDYFKITVYDDSSDDGSYEKMKSLTENNADRLRIKRLVRSKKILHPKGMGVEAFIQDTRSDILLINDADSLISLNDFEKALNCLLTDEFDVVHLSRKNDLSDSLATRVSDTEEMVNTSLKLFGISEWCFPGSGILMKKDAAEGLNYADFVPGDDLEMGRQLKENGMRIHHFQTLFVHEKAPTNFRDFFAQREKWCRNIAYHLFEAERFGTYVQTIGSSLTLFFLFGLFSPLSLGLILIGMVYTCMGFISRMLFAKESFSSSFMPVLLNTMQVWIQGAVFTPFYMLIYPFKRNRMEYKKSKV